MANAEKLLLYLKVMGDYGDSLLNFGELVTHGECLLNAFFLNSRTKKRIKNA